MIGSKPIQILDIIFNFHQLICIDASISDDGCYSLAHVLLIHMYVCIYITKLYYNQNVSSTKRSVLCAKIFEKFAV